MYIMGHSIILGERFLKEYKLIGGSSLFNFFDTLLHHLLGLPLGDMILILITVLPRREVSKWDARKILFYHSTVSPRTILIYEQASIYHVLFSWNSSRKLSWSFMQSSWEYVYYFYIPTYSRMALEFLFQDLKALLDKYKITRQWS